MPMALEGIRVLDLSRLAPGPYCSMILGDLGADVIRIESADPRGRLEGVLGLGPDATAEYRAYNPQGRNKKSIVIDLSRREGREVFYRLAGGADVILEEFRPGVVKKLGVDYETVREINPLIIYCSLTGYGQNGPYAKMPGHDINYIALAGALNVIRDSNGRPVIPSNMLADMAGGGMHAAIGILAALVARSLHGTGQHIDCAMVDGVISLAHFEPLWEGREYFGLPFYDVYQTADGKWISIGNMEPWFWANFCRAIGREDMVPYQYDPGRDDLKKNIAGIFREKTRDQWFDLLKDKDVCVAPVYTMEEASGDPHILSRGMFEEVDHPGFGKIRQVGVSPKLSATPGRIRSTAPLPGQHTGSILGELGYTSEEIKKMRDDGIVA